MQMVRGDTHKFKFIRKTKSGEKIMLKPEKVYVTFKYNEEREALFQKTLDNGIIFNETTGYYHVEIKPEDTNELPFGTLVYDIEIINNADEVKTLKVGTLELKKEVTFKNNEV